MSIFSNIDILLLISFQINGKESNTDVPHLGTHTWPEINKSVLTIVDDELADTVEM
jgi:hypothetical protein